MGVYRVVEGIGVASIDRLIAPVEDHLSGDFGMELDAINRFVVAKSLLAAFIGVGQRVGPWRQSEGFVVPVKKHCGGGQTAKYRILLGCGVQMDGGPSYLLFTVSIHVGAKGLGY